MLRARWVTLRACGATFRCGTPACGVSRAPRSTTAASTTPGAFPLDSNERFRGSTGVSLSTALLCTGRGKKCVVHRDAKLRNGYVCDFGWMIAHAAVSRRPPVSLDTIVARTHMYTHDCEFGICPSFKRHFFVAPCRPNITICNILVAVCTSLSPTAVTAGGCRQSRPHPPPCVQVLPCAGEERPTWFAVVQRQLDLRLVVVSHDARAVLAAVLPHQRDHGRVPPQRRVYPRPRRDAELPRRRRRELWARELCGRGECECTRHGMRKQILMSVCELSFGGNIDGAQRPLGKNCLYVECNAEVPIGLVSPPSRPPSPVGR
jgi:hypothetical protein